MFYFTQRVLSDLGADLAQENYELLQEMGRQQRLATSVTEQMSVEAQVGWGVGVHIINGQGPISLYPPYPKDQGMLWFYVEAARRPQWC